MAVRRLGGGLNGGMHVVEIETAAGRRRRLVLRRYADEQLARQPDACEREWKLLAVLEGTEIPAPRGLWHDGQGASFAAPAMAMSWLPGRPLLAPRDVLSWAEQLGATLASVHAIAPDAHDLSFLRVDDIDSLQRLLDLPPSAPYVRERSGGHPKGPALWEAVRAWWYRQERLPLALIHGDYWTGNTLWRRGRLTGLVDWGHAVLGNPYRDLCSCRLDLAFLAGLDASDTFLRAYERARGRAMPWMFLWDVLNAWQSIPWLPVWVGPYHELGRPDITVEVLRSRLDQYVDQALSRVP